MMYHRHRHHSCGDEIKLNGRDTRALFIIHSKVDP